MSEINSWDVNADDNVVNPPHGFPEGMSAQSYNDACRELMAAMKRYYDMLYSIPVTTFESGETSRHYKVVLPETITEYRNGLTFRMRIHEEYGGSNSPTIKVENLDRVNIYFTYGSDVTALIRNEIIRVTYDKLSVPPAFRMVGRLPVLQGTPGMGTQGFRGPQGFRGTQGAQGAQGIPGPKGDAGSAGSRGATGSSGSRGSSGPRGSQGASGSSGATGARGATSTVTGPQGNKGPVGNTGPRGATGPQGPPGQDGRDGNIRSDGGPADGGETSSDKS